MRLILDTNLLISAILSKQLRQRLEPVIIEPETRLLICKELLEEFSQVIRRPKFENYVSTKQTNDYLAFLQQKFEVIEILSEVQVCRDSDDDFLLALAQDGKADYLITGDNDLLVLSQFGQTRIVNLTTFLQNLN